MIMDGKSSQVVDKIAPLIGQRNHSNLQRPQGVPRISPASLFEQPVLHNANTDMNQWQGAIDRNQPNSYFSSQNNGLANSNDSNYDAPIKVVLSEAWSWAKFSRNLIGKVLIGVLLMTGLSVVLDQQGIMKNGMGGSTEVSPVQGDTKVTFDDVQGVDEAKHELEEVVAFLKEPGFTRNLF